ncbi:AMP-dependent synthetase [Sesbania bispinosa]|nr:AMP-dependent synthetase [Sesbania bispinosa]
MEEERGGGGHGWWFDQRKRGTERPCLWLLIADGATMTGGRAATGRGRVRWCAVSRRLKGRAVVARGAA